MIEGKKLRQFYDLSILIQKITEQWLKTMYKSVLYEIYNVVKLFVFMTINKQILIFFLHVLHGKMYK